MAIREWRTRFIIIDFALILRWCQLPPSSLSIIVVTLLLVI